MVEEVEWLPSLHPGVALTASPPLFSSPRSTTWPASCRCREPSRPGRCGAPLPLLGCWRDLEASLQLPKMGLPSEHLSAPQPRKPPCTCALGLKLELTNGAFSLFLDWDGASIQSLPPSCHAPLWVSPLCEVLRGACLNLTHGAPSGLSRCKSGFFSSPTQNPPAICPFQQEDFLKTLEHSGPQLTCVIKGDWIGLYR